VGVIELAAPPVRVTIDPAAGGRLASFQLQGYELLVTKDQTDGNPFQWGSYPMVPYAGRVRRGRFEFLEGNYQLPIAMPPHAIHGTVYNRPWWVEADGTLSIELGDSWPFGGYAIQRFDLTNKSFTCTIEVHNDHRSMPAMAGWHPWFRRPVALMFAARTMYVRDADGIPTGQTVPTPPGPWDDCFTDLIAPPKLTWRAGPALTLTSSCDHWVVYDEPRHAVCVEPQTAPPDVFNRTPTLVEPGHPLIATMTFTW
jgi:aldose 1-epimerase